MHRKILVTGGTGLLGTGLRLQAKNFPEREFVFLGSRDCNLTSLDSVLRCVEQHRPDAILNFAAISGGIGFSMKYPATLLRDNVLMNLNLLEAARLLSVPKSVHFLSVGMYPPTAPIPLKETSLHDGKAHETNYSYAYAKRLIEPAIHAYQQEYGLDVIGLVPNGIFGENMNYRPEESIMLAALIRRFYEHRDDREDLVVWGDGTALREYTYAQDMARACLWCLDHYDNADILNIGSTEEHSVGETARMIAEIMGIDQGRIRFDTTKPGGIHRRSTDNSRFVELSGFQYTPFRQALANTIHWFMDNHGKPGKVRL
ncbi:MAG TPA: NAD-dependent epimerase/dehydratase family protein [Verrucomicrobiae bacterium]|nr:NAD-dependent epimerase/dehydratase family protein [Verrucomicrobiae bacterium]